MKRNKCAARFKCLSPNAYENDCMYFKPGIHGVCEHLNDGDCFSSMANVDKLIEIYDFIESMCEMNGVERSELKGKEGCND